MKIKLNWIKSFLLGAILLTSTVLYGEPPKKVSTWKTVSHLKKLRGVKNASLSVKVLDLTTGRSLYQRNSKESLTPASNLKLLTTAMALEVLGKDYQFQTKIYYSGEIDPQGVLHGNIYVVGGGDPTLGSKYLVARDPEYPTRVELGNRTKFLDQWVEKVQGLGIKSIDGAIIADDSHYPTNPLPPMWEWGDLRYEFGSPPSALTFMDNNISLQIRKMQDGVKTIVDPVTSHTKIINNLKYDSKKKDITLISPPYTNELILDGTIDDKIAKYTTTMKDPSETLVRTFAKKLKSNGVSNKGGRLAKKEELSKIASLDDSLLIFTENSPKLSKIVEYTNKHSVNLFAEHLRIAIERKTGMHIKDLWRKRINTQGLYMADGSGLSRYNGVTSITIVDLLRYMKKSKNFKVFYNSLPQPNQIGTLRSFKPHSVLTGKLRAKSGTLSGIKAYSGYLKSQSGHLLAFSIILNHHGLSKTQAGEELERLMTGFYYLK